MEPLNHMPGIERVALYVWSLSEPCPLQIRNFCYDVVWVKLHLIPNASISAGVLAFWSALCALTPLLSTLMEKAAFSRPAAM
jgi:hypothetical protein